MSQPTIERCPDCGRSITYLSAAGCRGQVVVCRNEFHCRDETHRLLAHPVRSQTPHADPA